MKYLSFLTIVLSLSITGCGSGEEQTEVTPPINEPFVRLDQFTPEQPPTNLRNKNVSSNISVGDSDLVDINNHIATKYIDISINKVSLTIKNKHVDVLFDVTSTIKELGERGEEDYNKAISFIQELIEYYVTDKIDTPINSKNFTYTVDGRKNENRLLKKKKSAYRAASGKKVITINPGHGYTYNKSSKKWEYSKKAYNGIIEDLKTIEIASLLYDDIKDDYEVYFTRERTDNNEKGASGNYKYTEGARQYIKSLLPLSPYIWDRASSGKNRDKDINTRARYANDISSDILVSIHTNGQTLWACRKKGTKIYYANNNNYVTESKELAETALKNIVRKIQDQYDPNWPNGEVIGQPDDAENWLAEMPSIIVEVAYHDCPSPDAEALKNGNFINLVNRGINDSIDEYFSVSRAKTLKLLLDKFEISSRNSGFNQSIFGETITIPNDVNTSTNYYDYIVSAYNRGIVSSNNGAFNPDESITLAEFLKMVTRAIPIPLNNPDYSYYPYDRSAWYYKYARAALNAGIIDSRSYDFNRPLDKSTVSEMLDKAYIYFKGSNSGISIYAKWDKRKADVDLYLFSQYNANNSIKIEHDDNFKVTNMSSLRASGGIVYWNAHSSAWGANLDYDSWGGNGSQPWSGSGEERVTVDSQMVRRPGKYSIILCQYEWNNASNPSSVSIQWWGINKGRNINTGGENFNSTVKRGECRYTGTLSTN